MVSALRAVDSVFKLHVFHATAKTAYLKSIKLKVTDGQSTHLTNPVVISYKMCCCRMPRLSNDECNRAVTMLLQGATQHHTTVHRLQGRLVQFGNTNDRSRSGRPRVTTARQNRLMRLMHLRNRTQTAVETAITTPGTHNHRIHAQTVRNRLREFGIRAYRPYVGNPLTPRRGLARMQWLRRHDPRIWRRQRWQAVLFTDESRLNLFRADGRRRVYRRRNERYADCCVIEGHQLGGGSVMVWCGIAYGRRTQLHIIQGNLSAIRYRDEIISPHLVPFLQQHNLTLQQDNTPPHVARICTAYLQTHNIDVLPWPAFSIDLNPIEYLWDELDRRMRWRDKPPSSVPELEQALLQEWNNIPQMTVNNLINSTTRRVQSALDANGGHSRY